MSGAAPKTFEFLNYKRALATVPQLLPLPPSVKQSDFNLLGIVYFLVFKMNYLHVI